MPSFVDYIYTVDNVLKSYNACICIITFDRIIIMNQCLFFFTKFNIMFLIDLRVQIKVNPLGAVEWSVRVGGFPDVHSVREVVLLAPLQHLRAGERSVNLLVLRLPLVLPHHLTGRSDQNFWETAKGMECTM